MEKYLLTVIVLVTLTSCAVKPWTKGEKAMLAASCVAAALDAGTTMYGVANGCSESQPAIGKNPTAAVIISFTAVIQLGFIVAAHFLENYRLEILGGKTIANTACAVCNSTQY